jgi:hypothetical protein
MPLPPVSQKRPFVVPHSMMQKRCSFSDFATRIGYARVSTDDQTLDLQRNALERAKCRRIYEEHAS